MSIELKQARKKIDILENLAKNPELILTELFKEGIDGTNFLYQIRVNGKYILDYFNEYLLTLPVFDDCVVKNEGYYVNISVPCLKIGEFSDLWSNDNILKINASERTFLIINRNIDEYEKFMNKKIIKEVDELEEHFKKFENLTLKKRFKNSFNVIRSKKRILIKIMDFAFWLYIRKSKVNNYLDKEYKRIESENERNEIKYNKEIEKQNYYIENAPSHIEKIKRKQKEISEYLLSLGYKENKDMSIY